MAIEDGVVLFFPFFYQRSTAWLFTYDAGGVRSRAEAQSAR
jgi:hypothetical protein